MNVVITIGIAAFLALTSHFLYRAGFKTAAIVKDGIAFIVFAIVMPTADASRSFATLAAFGLITYLIVLYSLNKSHD